MKPAYLLPDWAPRLKPFLIRRLYESDANGLLDLELLDKVGWALYSRCASFLDAAEARQGRVRCPACRRVVISGPQSKTLIHCPVCGWECTLRAYMDSFKNQQLDGGPEVVELFQNYFDAFPKAKDASEKMLAIDALIHGFHHFLTSGRTRRPVCINLIDGHLEFVVQFLDKLTYGPGSTPGLEKTHVNWKEKVKGKL